MDGSLDMPVPTYLICGNNKIDSTVSDVITRHEGVLSTNVTFLGGGGIITTAQGLKIAYASGAFDPVTFYGDGDASNDEAQNPAFSLVTPLTGKHVQALKNRLQSTDTESRGVDVLITFDWPQRITDLSNVAANLNFVSKQVGVPPLALLVSEVVPRYHFAASEGLFFEREPFFIQQSVYSTRFIGLGGFGATNKERWHYAVNITPLSSIDAEQLKAKPKVFTANPLVQNKKANKRQHRESEHQDDSGSFFWNQRGHTQTPKPPPKGYVCHKCNEPGHWIADCPLPSTKRTKDASKPDAPFKDILNRDSSLCWFCLSNPKLETQLVISINSETYLTLAKGALVENHTLIVPIGHFQSTRSMQVAMAGESQASTLDADAATHQSESAKKTWTEISEIKNKIATIESQTSGQCIISFEVFAGSTSGVHQKHHHLHVHVVPVPADLAPLVEDAFVQQASDDGLEVFDELPDDISVPYIRVELPDGKVIVLAPSDARIREYEQEMGERMNQVKGSGKRFPQRLLNLQLGRLVLAKLLGMPDRLDWKRCIQSAEEETATVNALRTKYSLE